VTFLRFQSWPRSRILGSQPAGAVATTLLDPRVTQLVRGVRAVEIVLGDPGAAAVHPAVERGGADLQDSAQETDGMGGLLRSDEPVDRFAGHRSVSRAKKTAAFRKTSSSATAKSEGVRLTGVTS
jgi:hypothetical protein